MEYLELMIHTHVPGTQYTKGACSRIVKGYLSSRDALQAQALIQYYLLDYEYYNVSINYPGVLVFHNEFPWRKQLACSSCLHYY